MNHHRTNIKRRQFLNYSLTGLVGLSAGIGLPGISLARVNSPRVNTDKRLVVIFLRGAMDGLAAVPAYADPSYRSARNKMALAESPDSMLDLNGFFALHTALEPLHNLYQQNELAVLHAIASPYRKRSHFDAQNLVENGTLRPNGANSGWLNRALGVMGNNAEKFGVAIGTSKPLIIEGPVPVQSWSPSKLPDADADFLSRVSSMYENDSLLATPFKQGLQSNQMMPNSGKKKGGRNKFAAEMVEATSRFLAAKDGPRIATLDFGGWDTHANQGKEKGRLANQFKSLAHNIAKLKSGLGAAIWQDTVVLVITEFGRTVSANGTNGTDHGTASAAFAIGGSVAGGRVIANWPGLSQSKLYKGRDLAPTMDLRALFMAVLNQHNGLPLSILKNEVFPGSSDINPISGLCRSA